MPMPVDWTRSTASDCLRISLICNSEKAPSSNTSKATRPNPKAARGAIERLRSDIFATPIARRNRDILRRTWQKTFRDCANPFFLIDAIQSFLIRK
jgi:hypothetical protein